MRTHKAYRMQAMARGTVIQRTNVRLGRQLREAESGFRYTPTTRFETFHFPQSHDDRHATISHAAEKLNELR